ncbi:MAG: sigma-70 family RNA polymerase sigma factor [Pseudomonadota bacterium]
MAGAAATAAAPARLAVASPEAGEDEALMVAFGAGEAPAFDTLYERYRGPVYRFFARQLRVEDAQEAHQDTWLRVVRARERYRPTSSFRSYLFTIAHNVLTDLWRRQGRRPADAAVDPDELVGRGDPQAESERAELVDQFFALLAQLPMEQREAFVLREDAGLSNEQIAEVTGVGVETVRSRIRYAVRKLKGGMAPHGQ